MTTWPLPHSDEHGRHEFACDRCDATLWAYADECVRLGLGCDCGGAWIDLAELEAA